MLRLGRILLMAILLLPLAACEQKDAATQAKFYAFGTEVDVTLWGVDDEAATALSKYLEAEFAAVNATWHAWQPSTLMHINAAIAAGESISITPEVETLIRRAQDMAQRSHHLFNPAAGKLFELWGFHQDDWFVSRAPPASADISAWLANRPTMESLHLHEGNLWSDNTGVKLGFGAFAKGYAVDLAIEAIKAQGIGNAIVNIGGDLRAIGSHGARPWRIGIRHPRQAGAIATVQLAEGDSVFTSGDYERFFEHNGVQYAHILDPRTGAPATGAISATVLHGNGAEADAAATALFVAGKDWPQIAASMGIDRVMMVMADGSIEMSAKMALRTTLTDGSNTIIIRDLP